MLLVFFGRYDLHSNCYFVLFCCVTLIQRKCYCFRVIFVVFKFKTVFLTRKFYAKINELEKLLNEDEMKKKTYNKNYTLTHTHLTFIHCNNRANEFLFFFSLLQLSQFSILFEDKKKIYLFSFFFIIWLIYLDIDLVESSNVVVVMKWSTKTKNNNKWACYAWQSKSTMRLLMKRHGVFICMHVCV